MSVDPSDATRRARDRALVEAHCAGDPAAFPAIVRDHYAPLLATAQRRLGSRVEAEDAVQEAFERAYRGLCRLDGEYRIGAWLHRVLSNVCIDHANRRQVQRSLPDRIGPRLATVPDPAEHASDPIVFAAVQAAIDTLPASQRQTFLLHEVDGLSYPELAEHLGISEDNARARVHRAKVTLRARLARVNVAAILAIPAGLRLRFRRSAAPADDARVRPALDSGRELAQTTAGAGRPSLVTQAAYSIASNPVAELAAGTTSGGSRLFVVVAASVAAAIGGVVAVPSVTGSSSPASAPVASVAAPALDGIQIDDRVVDDALAGELPTTDAVPTTDAAAAKRADSEWIAAGAALVGGEAEVGALDDSPAGAPQSGGSTAPDACPWVAEYPDILTAPSAPSDVGGTLDRVEASVRPGPAVLWWADTTLHTPDAAGARASDVTTVTIRTQACLVRGRAAILIDLEDQDGARAQLRGARVLRLSDDVSVFRGKVVVPDGSPNVLLPWHLSERFVARLEVDAGGTARLDVAFLGEPSFGGAPTTPAADPAPTTTTTAPPATTPTTTTTTTTTAPSDESSTPAAELGSF